MLEYKSGICHPIATSCRTLLKASVSSFIKYPYTYTATHEINLFKQLSWLKLREMNIQLNLFWISFRYSNKLNLWLVHLWYKLFYVGVKWLFTMCKLWSLIHTCVTTRSSIIQEFEKLATVSALNCCSIGTSHSSKTTLGQTYSSRMSVLEDNENAALKRGRVVPSTPD